MMHSSELHLRPVQKTFIVENVAFNHELCLHLHFFEFLNLNLEIFIFLLESVKSLVNLSFKLA